MKMILVVFSFILGFASNFLLFPFQSGSFGSIDNNNDGIDDEFYEKHSKYQHILKIDRNFDGDIDAETIYLESGDVLSSRSDENFDGYFETETTYSNNQITSVQIDHDKDSVEDSIFFYEYGILKKSIFFDPKSREKKVISQYDLGKRIESFVDTNSDGVFDLKCEYSFFEQESCKKGSKVDRVKE